MDKCKNMETKIDKKTKIFNDLVFKHYSAADEKYVNTEKDSFDKINYMYNKTRNLLIKQNPKIVNKLIIQDLFDLCTTIIMVSVESKRSLGKDLSFNSDDKDSIMKEYDPEYGFVEPNYVMVKEKVSGKIMFIEEI